MGSLRHKQFVEIRKVRIRSSRPEVFCKKETLAQLCSCEFCENSKNTYIIRPVAASEESIDEILVYRELVPKVPEWKLIKPLLQISKVGPWSRTELSIFNFCIFCSYGSSIFAYYVCTEHHGEAFTFVDYHLLSRPLFSSPKL